MVSGIDKVKPLLAIAIPTYNRADRLERSLSDLFCQIIQSNCLQLVSVLVSNNGSTDTTDEVIDKYKNIFKQNKIYFASFCFSENRGFDLNVLNCYENCNSEYIWFLSDDDIIIDGAIDSIINDLQGISPSVLYYNFEQEPYNIDNPYIKENNLYKNVDINNIQSILKIIKYPKLTSLVLKKFDGKSGDKSKEYCFDYMHIAIAIQTGLDYGRIFHSNKRIARPDDDYMDHIDFLPCIQNNLIKTVSLLLNQNNKNDFFQHLKLETVDPLTSSMNFLSAYYRGKYALTPALKIKLYSTVANELKNLKNMNVKRIMLITVSFLKMIASLTYNIGHLVLTRKSATRIRLTK